MALPTDHSLTYRLKSPRNLPHWLRLRAILRTIRGMPLPGHPRYADFGCSNGYLTEKVRTVIGARACDAFDHVEEHFDAGRQQFPFIDFQLINLNAPSNLNRSYDLVTCFETLEHVGDLRSATATLLSALAPSGRALWTVPIEIGPRGVAKFIIKKLYGYSMDELPNGPSLTSRYLRTLVRGGRISQFRDQRQGWGTHFGFDYRDIDDILRETGCRFDAWNQGTTRFYLIENTI